MKDFISYLDSTYYLALISLVLSVVAIHHSFKNKVPMRKPLRAYLIVYCIGLILNIAYSPVHYSIPLISNFLVLEDFAFTIFEITVFTIILYKSMTSARAKAFAKDIYILYVVITAVLSTSHFFGSSKNSLFVQKSYLIQAFAMLIIVAIYFIDILRNPLKNDVSNEPAFWIASAISICLVCTIPATLLIILTNGKDKGTESVMYGIIHILYGVLFIMLIRAFKCKPALA